MTDEEVCKAFLERNGAENDRLLSNGSEIYYNGESIIRRQDDSIKFVFYRMEDEIRYMNIILKLLKIPLIKPNRGEFSSNTYAYVDRSWGMESIERPFLVNPLSGKFIF